MLTGIEALFPGTRQEIRAFNEMGKRQDRSSEKAPSLRNARRDLRLRKGPGSSWLPGLDSKTKLFPVQIQGVSWIKSMLCSSTSTAATYVPAAVLADECGIGKTIQAIATIATKVTHRDWGAKKPTVVICPKIVAPMWFGELTKRLPRDYTIIYYAADVNHKMVHRKTLRRRDVKG